LNVLEAVSVHYGVVAMAVAELLVIAVLAYLRSASGREPYLSAWLVSYVGQLTLHVCWHPLMAGLGGRPLLLLGGVAGLVAAGAMVLGTLQHLGRPLPRGSRTVGALVFGATLGLGLIGGHPALMGAPVALSLGIAFLASGIVVIRSGPKTIGVWMAGIGMIALGIHSIDFPILAQFPAFIPWGQLINSWLLLMVGMGLVLMHTERVERKSAEQARALQQAQRMEAIGRLAGGVAHDFNNLLTVINVNLAMASRQAASTTRPLLEVAQNAADRAAELTKQLLTFSRPQPHESLEVNLVQVVRRIMDVLRRTIEEHVELDLRLADGEVIVVGDPGQLEQVILNLALNARDAMPDGGLLSIRVHARDGRAIIEVEDTGEGMPDEILTHIFEPFFTTKEIGKGTGLGLATVYAVVKRLDGTIDVHSVVGEGSRFRVSLPLARVSAAVEDEQVERRAARPHGAGAQILLVEDQPDLCRVVAQILESVGFVVVSAFDGAEALERAHGRCFDLVMTDVVMPKMSGPELVRAIRERGCNMPVLYMSGYPDRSQAEVNRDDGELLTKPFTPEDLLHAVHRALGRRPPRAKLEAS
jgi:signal transduction histidine kinase/CheY-like chemotaxis protein